MIHFPDPVHGVVILLPDAPQIIPRRLGIDHNAAQAFLPCSLQVLHRHILNQLLLNLLPDDNPEG